ncbi:hypothetical protein AK812_SmicGene14002 [Symbiodinium microadriaticum]|uniref:Uncharacterized protein n=1 Tax=Symbiodinium microadriaticum TaxID=2951 RepID=A0A1Q9E6L7_SYMMI|nr:hypothetical protein AK812_SmicGene14002 [Symbiodinium microadriaticum]CAE7571513.1 unnamed protein product [Symbiodinium microadriaticum]
MLRLDVPTVDTSAQASLGIHQFCVQHGGPVRGWEEQVTRAPRWMRRLSTAMADDETAVVLPPGHSASKPLNPEHYDYDGETDKQT